MSHPPGKPADLSNPVPDICERMVYTRDGRTDHMRVTGWYCLKKAQKPRDENGVADQIITEILREENAMGYFLVPCTREEATVVALYAIAGALVRLNNPGLTRVGEYVPWSEGLINSDRDSWLNFHCKQHRHVMGGDHRKMITEMFPDVDFSYPY